MALQLRRLAVMAAVLAASLAAAEGFNITKILGEHPEYSQFNKLLTQTRLAGDINRRRTITVLAVANGDMGDLTSGRYSLGTLRHILELHIIVDYFDAKKLKQLSHGATAASTMFQVLPPFSVFSLSSGSLSASLQLFVRTPFYCS
ncbi:hypothetical protein PR202_ga20713 [Eleusine coracana subsp. coracana]|uniref:FAS1 domain-containing protein n=1 Tax=Eleusine coracana subsp. coracana TaxID=191504 RepID=A0AAV5CXD1_ELECO|nr:hypothetical protein PR202_ga20713 [Eleusine coracana subsp. coracana]